MVAGRERWEFHKRQSGIASHHQGFGLVLFFDDVLSEGSDGIAIELFSPFLLRYKDRVQASNVLVLLYCLLLPAHAISSFTTASHNGCC